MITGDFRAVYGSPYMRLHRLDLRHAMMMRLAEVAPGALRLGSGVDRLEHGGAGVTLRFTDDPPAHHPGDERHLGIDPEQLRRGTAEHRDLVGVADPGDRQDVVDRLGIPREG